MPSILPATADCPQRTFCGQKAVVFSAREVVMAKGHDGLEFVSFQEGVDRIEKALKTIGASNSLSADGATVGKGHFDQLTIPQPIASRCDLPVCQAGHTLAALRVERDVHYPLGPGVRPARSRARVPAGQLGAAVDVLNDLGKALKVGESKQRIPIAQVTEPFDQGLRQA
jgi:hypothetical protein